MGLAIIQSSVEPNSGVSEVAALHFCPSKYIARVPLAPVASIRLKVLCFVTFCSVGKIPASVGFSSEGRDFGEKPFASVTVNCITWPMVCFSASVLVVNKAFCSTIFVPTGMLEKSTSMSARSAGDRRRDLSVAAVLR